MNVIPTTFVLEVLNKHNYEVWSEVVKSCLIARNLWDIVKPDDQDLDADQDDPNVESDDEVAIAIVHVKPEPQESGNDRKNAAALHAIKISCGPEALQEIRRIYLAKEAWKTLEDKFKLDFYVELFPCRGESDAHDLESYRVFFNAIEIGDWDNAKRMYEEDPNLLKKTFTNNFTALHYAVWSNDNEGIVKDMRTHMSKEDLERKESIGGCTALALATGLGTPNMVQWMIEKNDSLPLIEDNDHSIPIVTALSFLRTDVVRILYRATKLEVLSDRRRAKHGIEVISRCIKIKTAETIAIALDLLHRCPNLAIAKDRTGKSTVYTLACATFLFREGFGLRFWEQWIYDFISIKSALARYEKNEKSAVPGQMEGKTGPQSGGDTTSKNSVLLAPFRWLFSKLPFLFSKLLILSEVDKRIGELKLVHILSSKLVKDMCHIIADIRDIRELKDGLAFDALFAAVDRGNVTFVDGLTTMGPVFAACKDEHGRDIFMRAIEYRQD